MPTLYLLIGGNQGDRTSLLQQTTDLLRQRVGSVVCCSHIYETAPWGQFDRDNVQSFLNMAVVVKTDHSAEDCLTICQQIEYELGRRRPAQGNSLTRVYSSRPIDIDLIFYGDAVIDTPKLTIPHPRMHLRRFVLQPMCDIAPYYNHPILNKTLTELLNECTDTSSCLCCSL